MTPFRRLLEYARPHRGRLTVALLAMVLYGAGTAGTMWYIRPILDSVLPNQERLLPTIVAILTMFFLEGLGPTPRRWELPRAGSCSGTTSRRRRGAGEPLWTPK